ncbi:hypothetical protein OS493_026492 [Desmophyllum pertusum]|uniref:Uncharacterized protein n=1 Tax=Desmophyllum pertusum TaxID=174260 RepID=A0A9W9YKR9_9CNID|nr:hypothetical protein OS493_026492 [Desmophyllum pertusum]
MNSTKKEMRREASDCLVIVLKDAKVQKRPECRAWLERRSSEVLFYPDRATKTSLVHFLYKNQNLQHELPVDLHIEHLSSTYRNQTLEINNKTISKSLSCFVNHGMFSEKESGRESPVGQKETSFGRGSNLPRQRATDQRSRQHDTVKPISSPKHSCSPQLRH